MRKHSEVSEEDRKSGEKTLLIGIGILLILLIVIGLWNFRDIPILPH